MRKNFKKIGELEKQCITFLEEFCLIESPADYKERVDAAERYIIERAKDFGWKVDRQEQKIAGDCIRIKMNPDAKEAPVCFSVYKQSSLYFKSYRLLFVIISEKRIIFFYLLFCE